MKRIVPILAAALCSAPLIASEPDSERSRETERSSQHDERKHKERRSLHFGEHGSIDSEGLRAQLERMSAFAERMLEKNKKAIEMLDDGADPSQVMRTLRTPDLERFSRDVQPVRGHPVSADREPRISDQRLDEARVFIAKNLPRMDEQLSKVDRLGPSASRKIVSRMAPRILDIIDTGRVDPELSGLKLDDLRSGLSYVEATRILRVTMRDRPEDADALREAERGVLDAARARFDAQVKLKEHEISRLSERIQELRGALDDLNDQRDSFIESQLESAKRLPEPRGDRRGREDD